MQSLLFFVFATLDLTALQTALKRGPGTFTRRRSRAERSQRTTASVGDFGFSPKGGGLGGLGGLVPRAVGGGGAIWVSFFFGVTF